MTNPIFGPISGRNSGPISGPISGHAPGVTLVTVPCLSDNYAYLIHNAATGQTALIDAPEAAPIRAELQRHNWRLDDILLTHHHNDHIQAVAELARSGARVIGAAPDAHRLPPLGLAVQPGEEFPFCGMTATVIDAPGHTIGHVAYDVPAANAVFTGDSLMALGCGRLFEGTARDMLGTLDRIAALPPGRLVCSGHEYAAVNARFALTVEPGNSALQDRARLITALRAEGRPTVPSTLSEELATNPYLRCDQPEIRRSTGLPDAHRAEVLAAVRARKDEF